MNTYRGFAAAYDSFMDDVPYDEWAGNLLGILKKYNISGGTIVELGCGTGKMTARLAEAGYSMIGIDLSEEMLEIAEDQLHEDAESTGKYMIDGPEDDAGGLTAENRRIIYTCQDMRDFSIFGEADAVISVCDSMNYLIEEDDLRRTLDCAYEALRPGGLMVFDMKTEACYMEMGDDTYTDSRDQGLLIWANEYDAVSRINSYDIELFWKDEEDLGQDGYHRYFEQHFQRAYSVETVGRLMEETGLELLEVLDADTMGTYDEESLRLYYVAVRR